MLRPACAASISGVFSAGHRRRAAAIDRIAPHIAPWAAACRPVVMGLSLKQLNVHCMIMLVHVQLHQVQSGAPNAEGRSFLEDPTALCVATETAVFTHLFARYSPQDARFTNWRGKKDREVDLVADAGGQLVPFEVKYRARHTGLRELKDLLELCQQKAIDRGHAVTKSLDDFGVVADLPDTSTRMLRIPAPLLCYWMGESELTNDQA